MSAMPGQAVSDDRWNWRPASEAALSPEAQRRVDQKVESVRLARLRAAAEASQAVIG